MLPSLLASVQAETDASERQASWFGGRTKPFEYWLYIAFDAGDPFFVRAPAAPRRAARMDGRL